MNQPDSVSVLEWRRVSGGRDVVSAEATKLMVETWIALCGSVRRAGYAYADAAGTTRGSGYRSMSRWHAGTSRMTVQAYDLLWTLL